MYYKSAGFGCSLLGTLVSWTVIFVHQGDIYQTISSLLFLSSCTKCYFVLLGSAQGSTPRTLAHYFVKLNPWTLINSIMSDLLSGSDHHVLLTTYKIWCTNSMFHILIDEVSHSIRDRINFLTIMWWWMNLARNDFSTLLLEIRDSFAMQAIPEILI